MSRLVTIGNPFKHYKRATEKTVLSYVRVGVTVKTLKYVEKEKIKIPYTVNLQRGQGLESSATACPFPGSLQ